MDQSEISTIVGRQALKSLVEYLSQYERKWTILDFGHYSQFKNFGPPISGIKMSENIPVP